MDHVQSSGNGFAIWLCKKSLIPLFIAVGCCFLFRSFLWGMTVTYLLNSLWTFFFYYADKKAAEKGAERIPEAALHIWEFLCGWPGALAARNLFHHKSKKISYRIFFFLIVCANILTMLTLIQYYCYASFPWYSRLIHFFAK